MCQDQPTLAVMSTPARRAAAVLRPDDEVMGVNDAAKYCAVHRKTILRWISRGFLKSHALTPTSPYRIRRADIDALFLNSQLGHAPRPTATPEGSI